MSELRELGDISLPFALDEKKNYIYIKDAYRGRDYYCPCCGKKVNTIAIDEDKEYQMPPHYRHYPNQSCSGESLSHWVYKMWLFDKDSKFNVYDGSNKTEYIVKSIDIEKTYQTDYGDYRPDITIITTNNKTFFFELNFSNPKRSDDYFCKWSQLNYNVIEVDVKKLLKESLNNKIPTFRLIFSNGVCFDDKYNKRDIFANAANKLLVRKLEIQRQDMLNCKTIWEKLDWFFDSIKMFKAMKATMDDVLNSFSNVPFEEMELCFDIVKKISCINNNQGFRDIINKKFEKVVKTYMNKKSDELINLVSISYFTEIKNGFRLKLKVDKKYSICKNNSHIIDYYFINKKWHMSYNFFKSIDDYFVNFQKKLITHIKNITFINDNWIRYPFMYDNFIDNKLFVPNLYEIDYSKLLVDQSFIDNMNCKYLNFVCEKFLLKLQNEFEQKLNIVEKRLKKSLFNDIVFQYSGSNLSSHLSINIKNKKAISLLINYHNFIFNFADDTNKNYSLIININDIYELLYKKILIAYRKIEKRNKTEELFNENYCTLKDINLLETINQVLSSKYNLKFEVGLNLNKTNPVFIKYMSTICYKYPHVHTTYIENETFDLLINNNIFYNFITNDISIWIELSRVNQINNTLKFINNIENYNNDIWNFYFDNDNKTLDIIFCYKNPYGDIKFSYGHISLEYIENILYQDNLNVKNKIKDIIAVEMKNIIDSTMISYQRRYSNYRLIETEDKANA